MVKQKEVFNRAVTRAIELLAEGRGKDEIIEFIVEDIHFEHPNLDTDKLTSLVTKAVNFAIREIRKLETRIGREYPTRTDVLKRREELKRLKRESFYGIRGTPTKKIPIEEIRRRERAENVLLRNIRRNIGLSKLRKKGRKGLYLTPEDKRYQRKIAKEWEEKRALRPLKELEKEEKEMVSRREQAGKPGRYYDLAPWEEDPNFKRLPVHEREKQRNEWYDDHLEQLRNRLEKGEISKREYRQEKRELKRKAFGKLGLKRGARALGRFGEKFGGSLDSLAKKSKKTAMEILFGLGLILLGALVSVSFGNYWFFFAFLSIAAYVMTPHPSSGKFTEGPLGLGHMLPWQQGGSHAAFGFFRSIFKVTAIILFAMGFYSVGDVFNIFFIATCFIGYFMMSIAYDPKVPAEFIESVLRFGVLGCYFIPFFVFGGIFDSYVLVFIALAFFAIPPVPKAGTENLAEVLSRGLSGATAYYEMFDKLLFAGLMLISLIGSGALGSIFAFAGGVGWQLQGTLAYTFIYFWFVSGIAGFFSPVRERPLVGLIMMGGATVIYGVGPGSQQIGSALLGQWWPTVHETLSSIMDPIVAVFDQLSQTFGNAFLLLTNPVGYATQLMNGTYSDNPTGPTGAYGVEIISFDVSQVYAGQPFIITTMIKNQGSQKAEDIVIALGTPYDITTNSGMAREQQSATYQTSPPMVYPKYNPLSIITYPFLGKEKFLAITDIGISMDDCDNSNPASDRFCLKKGPETLNQGVVEQFIFQSDMIPCDIINTYQLRKKFMPIEVLVKYDYSAQSSLPIEFISKEEWDRLTQTDQLVMRKEIPKMSTAPVQFPIGTIEQPILASYKDESGNKHEGTSFYIGLKLESNEGAESSLGDVEFVELIYPKDFGAQPKSCSPSMPSCTVNGDTVTCTWQGLSGLGAKIFYCQFDALDGDKMGGSPTKTYVVQANTSYEFLRWDRKDVKIEFGSVCCSDDECLNNQECCNGACIPEGQECEGGETIMADKGDADYCEQKIEGNVPGDQDPQTPCDLGMGGCTDDVIGGESQCRQVRYPVEQDGQPFNLICRTDTSTRVCCPSEAQKRQCEAAYNAWLNDKAGTEILADLIAARATSTTIT